MDYITDFVNFASSLGFLVDKANIIADGKFHRLKYKDDKGCKTSGSYVLFTDYSPRGYIQNFKHAESFVWKYKESRLQSIIDPIKYQEAKVQRQTQIEVEYRKRAWLAYQKFCKLSLSPSGSTYLNKKQVKSYGIRFDEENNIHIPFRNNEGLIQTIQKITPDGNKQFAYGCKKTGAYHKIGFYDIDINSKKNYSGVILIGEGYATMASVYMAIRLPCVIAGDAGNIAHVISNLKKVYPDAKFIICADNDKVGIEKALICKDKFKCQYLCPNFNKLNNKINLNDFNDLHINLGLCEIYKQICREYFKLKLYS